MNRLLTGLVGAVVVLAVSAVPAAADPTVGAGPAVADPVTARDLLDRVGGAAATHVVVLIDTSGSMARGGLYGKVTSAVERFVGALGPTDTVSVIPFAEGPDTTCAVTADHPSLAGCIPDTPTPGAHTDIGRALTAAITDVQTQPQPGGVIVLVSDGEHDPLPDSPFPVPPSATADGWRELRARAAAVPDVSAYALPLSGTTSIGVLDVVFPDARTLTASSPARIEGLLRAVTDRRRRAAAAQRLGSDARPQVTASWIGNGTVDGSSGHGTAVLRVRSGAALVPLIVGIDDVHVDGYPVRTGRSAPVTVGPGGSADLAIPLEWAPPREAGAWRRTANLDATLTVGTGTTSPWADALRDLHIDMQPGVTGPGPLRLTSVQYRGWTGKALAVGGIVAVGLLALLAVGSLRAFIWWRRRHPAPTGVLRARPLFGGEWSASLPVGRLASLSTGGRVDGLPGRVAVRHHSVRNDREHWQPVYRITYTPPPAAGTPSRSDWSRCLPGGSVLVNGMLFVHDTTGRR